MKENLINIKDIDLKDYLNYKNFLHNRIYTICTISIGVGGGNLKQEKPIN